MTAVVLAVLGAWLVLRRITRASRQVGVGLQQLVADTSLTDDEQASDRTPQPDAPPRPRKSWRR